MSTSYTSTADLDLLVDQLVKQAWTEQPDYLDALDVNFELAIGHLIERRLDYTKDRSPQLVLHLTSALLLNYYIGCLLFQFIASHKTVIPVESLKSTRQQNIEQLLQRLAQFESCRQLMATYFTAALEKRLHRLWRAEIRFRPSTLAQGVARILLPIIFSDDWEKLADHGITFGLNGFFLLFSATAATVPNHEFESLLNYLRQLMDKGRWRSCNDVVHILSLAHLSPEQQVQLLALVESILDLSRYPYKDDTEDPRTRIDALQLSPLLTSILKRLSAERRDQPKNWAEINTQYRPVREGNAMIFRQCEVIQMLSALARQNDAALVVLQDITIQALKQQRMQYANTAGFGPASELIEASLESLLLVASTHRQTLDTLYTCLKSSGQTTLMEAQIKALTESDVRLSEESAEYLLNVIRAEDNACRWAEQILENVPGLGYEAIDLIVDILPEEQDVRVLQVLTRIAQKSVQGQGVPVNQQLQRALVARLKKLLFDPKAPLEADWIAFLSKALNREPLRLILDQAIHVLSREADISLQSRTQDVLRMIGQEAYRIFEPDAATLAACWLVDPTHFGQDPRPLADRVQEAKEFLVYNANHSIAKRIVEILDSVVAINDQVLEVVARSLRSFAYPNLAIPLLERLMDLAMLQRRSSNLYSEAFKSIATLRPLTPQALQVLQECLVVACEIDWPILLTPQIVYDEVLPLLTSEVPAESIEPLIRMVWDSHCEICSRSFPLNAYEQPSWRLYVEKLRHRYLHREPEVQEADELILLCALQVLTNVSTLSCFQQRIIKRLWQTSWRAPVKARALLILNRQRPLQEETIRTVERILSTNPAISFYVTLLKDQLRRWLFRRYQQRQDHLSDAHPGYIYLCQSVAISTVATFLREVDTTKYRKRLSRVLLKVVAPTRIIAEQQFAREASVGANATNKALAWIMGVVQVDSVHKKPIWVSRPSNIAYQTLRDLWSQHLLDI